MHQARNLTAAEDAHAAPGARRVPFGDLAREYAALRAEIDEALRRVCAGGWFVLGPEVTAFEQEFAAYCGARHAVAVASGTDALHLALRALGVGPGDEVITVAHTAVATVAAVALAGATPVLVDVDRTTGTMDAAAAAAAVGPRTRVLLPVHLYGQPAALDPLAALAARHGLALVEDACQAHGARYRGQRVGALGTAGCFSFYPTKNLGAYGDGGAVVTNDDALVERLRRLRQYGWRTRDDSVEQGLNSRLDEMQAAILRVKLRHLDAWQARRAALAARYTSGLAAAAPGIALPPAVPDTEPVWHLYVVRTRQREALRQAMAAEGVGTGIHYPIPVHRQDAYANLGLGPGSLPASERWAAEVLSLPLFPFLREDEVAWVVAAVGRFVASAGGRVDGGAE